MDSILIPMYTLYTNPTHITVVKIYYIYIRNSITSFTALGAEKALSRILVNC